MPPASLIATLVHFSLSSNLQSRATHFKKMNSYMHNNNRPSSSLKMKVSAATQQAVEDEYDDDVEDEEEGEDQEQIGGVGYHHVEGNLKKKKLSLVGVGGGGGAERKASGGGGVAPPGCQVEMCEADLTHAKKYHKRHKVCEVHAKASVVVVGGLRQRFCQQCSRFHVLSEFDDAKRSCRRRLAGHNERRRKSSSESRGEGSNRGGSGEFPRENQATHVDESGRSRRAFPAGSSHKNFHIH